MRKKLPPVDYLRECFLYESETGKLYWRSRPRSHFESTGEWKRFNSSLAGGEAFTTVNYQGYRYGGLDGQYFYVHRVIWKLVMGKEPPDFLDHRDRDQGNNRWPNLRCADKYTNSANRSVFAEGTVTGVHFCKTKQRWIALIMVQGKKLYLGRSTVREEAIAFRKAAEIQYHGEFAPQ